MMLWNTILLITVSVCAVSTQEVTPCSDVNKGDEELSTCLKAIAAIAQDTERFFFGSSYAEKCADADSKDIACYFPPGTRDNSIASTLLAGSFDATKLTTYLSLAVTSEPGEYRACDNTYKDDVRMTYNIDPTSNDTYPPWRVRREPVMSWQADEAKKYTLIVKYAGWEKLGALYVNIPGNRVTEADVEKMYEAPINFRSEPVPYVFLLYEQTNNITVSEEWKEKNRTDFDIGAFLTDYGLSGPVAMNWILTGFDAYGLQRVKSLESDFVENCASFVKAALEADHERTFIPEDTELSMWTRVQFSSAALKFSYCCEDYKYPDSEFYLNPIGNPVYEPALVRTGSDVTVHVTQNSLMPTKPDKKYTVIGVDPDVPFPALGTGELPLLHWLAYNCDVTGDDNKLMCEKEMPGWRGPTPPDDSAHTYYILLYEQEGEDISMNDTTKYAGACSDTLIGRCLFNITSLAMDQKLTLVGASWLRSENHAYVDWVNKVSEDESCDSCDVATTSRPFAALVAILVLVTSFLLK